MTTTENIKEWAISAVFSVAVAAVTSLLTPNGASEKSVKFLTSLFVLIMFISPFANLDLNAAEYTKGIDSLLREHELENQVEEQVKETLRSQIISSLSAYMKSIEVEFRKILIDMDIDENMNIQIKRIIIYLSSSNKSNEDKIVDYVAENYNTKAEFIIDGV